MAMRGWSLNLYASTRVFYGLIQILIWWLQIDLSKISRKFPSATTNFLSQKNLWDESHEKREKKDARGKWKFEGKYRQKARAASIRWEKKLNKSIQTENSKRTLFCFWHWFPFISFNIIISIKFHSISEICQVMSFSSSHANYIHQFYENLNLISCSFIAARSEAKKRGMKTKTSWLIEM